MWRCDTCGTDGNEDGQRCEVCFFVPVPAVLILTAASGREAQLRITCRLNRSWAKGIAGDEARFWDAEHQMTIERRATGWFVVPNPTAPNDTLLDGERVIEDSPLGAGQVLAVGREAKGVAKSPLVVSF